MLNPHSILLHIDLEMSGLSPTEHEILEIAIIREVDGVVTNVFHTLVKPLHIENADPVGLKMNGYAALPSRWHTAPVFDDIAGVVAGVCAGGTFVGQNVSSDILFLQEAFKRVGLPEAINYRPGDARKIDVAVLSHEHLVPCGLTSTGLQAVRKFLGWSSVGAHTAMVDAHDSRRLYHLLLRATWLDRLWWRVRNLFGRGQR